LLQLFKVLKNYQDLLGKTLLESNVQMVSNLQTLKLSKNLGLFGTVTKLLNWTHCAVFI